MKKKKYITVTELARRMGKSTVWIRRLLREGKIRGFKVGQIWLIPRKDWVDDDP